jgi:alkanesulfonate monooxygenase SsuD/methylene tetrahydromethanopterin reductase-like flavin-dependent oxidoreductase (luciferase family)
MAADVDRLSNGRLILGLGVGDEREEFEALGLPFPTLRERQRALPGYLADVRSYWAGSAQRDPMSYGPVQPGGVPVLIAGGGERVTLRQVAEHAEMCNFGPHEWTGGAYDAESVARKLAALRRHCEDLHRPFDSVVRSHYSPLVILAEDRGRLADKASAIIGEPREHFVPLVASPDEAVAHFQRLADLGMQYFLVNTRAADPETLDLLAERVIGRIEPG